MEKNLSFLKGKLIAHRGMHDIKKGIPENSLKAFKRAVENQYIIELDLHILKDGNVVVFHDDNLKRMTGLNRDIKDLEYEEIKKLSLKNTQYKIPLFEDVLKLVDGKVPIIIELKYDVKVGVLESKTMDILKNYQGKYVIKSFQPMSVYWMKKHYPTVIRGQLVSGFKQTKRGLKWYMILNYITKPDFISYDAKWLPNKKVEKYRKNKLVLGWTIRNKTQMKRAWKYCDNLICENLEELGKGNVEVV